MALDDDSEGLLSQLEYHGYTLKTVSSHISEDAIRIIDVSALTEMQYMTTVSAPIWARMEKAGLTGSFLWALQLVGILMLDSKLDRDK